MKKRKILMGLAAVTMLFAVGGVVLSCTSDTTEPADPTDPDPTDPETPVADPVVTKSLEVVSQPDKTAYKENDYVDYTGLEVQKVDKSDDVETSRVSVALTDLSFSVEEGTQLTEVTESLEVTVSLLDDPENEYGSVSLYLSVRELQQIVITFRYNGVTLYEDTILEGGTATYGGETPTYAGDTEEGYNPHFVGWYVQGDAEQTAIDLETHTFEESTTLLGLFVQAPDTYSDGVLTYNYLASGDGYYVNAYDSTSGVTDVVVPDDVVGGVPVVQVNGTTNIFRGQSVVTSVKLGKNVKTLGSRAFQGMTYENLTIELNEGLETITTGYTFYNNTGIKEITIPSTLTTFGSTTNYMFGGATNLKTVNWNTPLVTTVGGRMFQGTTSLETINLGEGVTITEFGAFAFYGSGIKNLTFDVSNVTSFGQNAFQGSSLESITIPSTTTEFSTAVFSGCVDLKTVTIEKADLELTSITAASNAPFYGCTGLETIYFNGTEAESRALIEAENAAGLNQFFGDTAVTVAVKGTDNSWEWEYSYSASE